jgi:hypothetical protein
MPPLSDLTVLETAVMLVLAVGADHDDVTLVLDLKGDLHIPLAVRARELEKVTHTLHLRPELPGDSQEVPTVVVIQVND